MAKRIKLTNKADDFVGTRKDENISGLGGDDNISAGGGNDVVNGGDGNDILKGGAGDDRINGGAGNDNLFGGTGDDTLNGGPGADTVDGGSGDDTVVLDGNFADAKITANKDGSFNIVTAGGTTTVSNVELFKFADGTKTAGDLIPAPPASFILTVNPDVLTGTNAADKFVGTETTLSSADDLDGADGDDTLQYSSSGAAAVVESGFKTKNIENFLVTSDAVGGTTFDVTGVTGGKNITNNNSSTSLAITGLSSIVDVGMTDVSGGDTTVTYKDAALVGAADIQNVNLSGNGNLAGKAASTLTIGSAGGTTGIETLNITTSGSASSLVDIVSGAKTINISGDKDLTVTSILDGATIIDASKATGAVSVVADSGVLGVTVTGGAGNDYADFSAGFTAGDKYDGGAGKDIIGLTNAVATSGVVGGVVSNVEVLAVTNAANGTIDMDKFTGINEVHLDGGIAAATTATIKNAATGLVVELDTFNIGANGGLTVDQKVDGAADTVTLNIDNIFKGDSYGVINLDDAETVTISAKDEDNTPGNIGLGGITIADLQVADATSITFTGTADITITDIDGNVDPTKNTLVTLDASGLSGDLKITGLGGATGALSTAGATITLGSGNDSLLDGTGLGADKVTLGAGKDVVYYNAIAQSSGAKVDTITDFVAGTDDIDLKALGINSVSQFTGTFASFAAAQGSISKDGAIEAVFQADTNTLWVDVNNDGALNANDLQVILTGVTSLKGTDLNLNGVGATFTANKVGFDTSKTTDSVEAVTTTDEPDTIVATAAQLVGATADGKLGEDTLKVTTAGVLGLTAAVANNIESLQLANGANTVTFGAGVEFKNVTGGTGVDNVTTANMDLANNPGGLISLVGGNDIVNFNQEISSAGKIGKVDLGEGDDSISVGITPLLTTLDGGAGTDTLTLALAAHVISGASVINFENLTLNAGGGAITLTADQNNQFTGTITAAGADAFTISTGGAVTALANIEAYTLSATGNSITLAQNATTVTGAAGNDTITGTAAQIESAIIDGGTGTDTVSITGGMAAAVTVTAASFITNIDKVTVAGASTANLLTVSSTSGATSVDASGITGGGININLAAFTVGTATLTAGNDTVSAIASNDGTAAVTKVLLDLGTGNATIADISARGLDLFEFEIDATAGATTAVTFSATTGALISGDVFDFSGAVSSIGTSLATSIAGQAVVTNAGGDTTITWDANGDHAFGAGDIQVVFVGEVLTAAQFGVNGDGDLYFL